LWLNFLSTSVEILENDIVKLRALELSDIDLIYKWENDSSNWVVSNTITPYSKFILQQYLDNSYKDIYEAKQLRLMIDLKTGINIFRTIGAIDLFDFDPYHSRAGVGILIAMETDRNHGYACEALKLLMDYSFKVLNLYQLYCNITIDNKKSIKLFTDLGFVITGEKQKWVKIPGGRLNEYFLQRINID
jgi:diamine N-acetyltransferase